MAEGPAASGAGPEGWVGQFAEDVLGGHAGRAMQLVSAVAARPDTAARGKGSRRAGVMGVRSCRVLTPLELPRPTSIPNRCTAFLIEPGPNRGIAI